MTEKKGDVAASRAVYDKGMALLRCAARKETLSDALAANQYGHDNAFPQ